MGYVTEGLSDAAVALADALEHDEDGKNAARYLWLRPRMTLRFNPQQKEPLRDEALDHAIDTAIRIETQTKEQSA